MVPALGVEPNCPLKGSGLQPAGLTVDHIAGEIGGSGGTRTLSLQIKSLLRCPVAPLTRGWWGRRGSNPHLAP